MAAGKKQSVSHPSPHTKRPILTIHAGYRRRRRSQSSLPQRARHLKKRKVSPDYHSKSWSTYVLTSFSQAKQRETIEQLRAAQEQVAERERELEAAQAEAAQAQAALQAQAEAAAAASKAAATPELIERPHGNFSLATFLQQHNILTDEQLAMHVSGITYWLTSYIC